MERIIITMTCKDEEIKLLTEEWKKTDGFTNRSQYIKAAINEYAHKEIFKI